MPAGKSNRNRLSISWIDVSKHLNPRQGRTNKNMINGDVAFVGTDVDRKEDSQAIVINISLRRSSECNAMLNQRSRTFNSSDTW
jgi:hypothetical protein